MQLMPFANWLAEQMLDAGDLTAADVAARLKVDEAAVNAWLAGQSAPPPELREPLARLLGCPESELDALIPARRDL